MSVYWSPSDRGWRDMDFYDYILPDDAIEVPREQYRQILADVNNGMELYLKDDNTLATRWPIIPLATYQAVRIEEWRALVKQEIVDKTFDSSALGSLHKYDSRVVDQTTLLLKLHCAHHLELPQEVLCSVDGESFEHLPHTEEQISNVLVDMTDHIQTIQTKFFNKKAEIMAATTNEQVDLVVWE